MNISCNLPVCNLLKTIDQGKCPNRKMQNVAICVYGLGTFCVQIFMSKSDLNESYIYKLVEQCDFAKGWGKDLLSNKLWLRSPNPNP